jgi:hypothetical protein
MPRYRFVLRIYKRYLAAEESKHPGRGQRGLIGLLTISGHGKPGTRHARTTFGALSSFYGYLAFKKMISANPVNPIKTLS